MPRTNLIATWKPCPGEGHGPVLRRTLAEEGDVALTASGVLENLAAHRNAGRAQGKGAAPPRGGHFATRS